ncbi:MAG: barstar family protein [Saprospiraceae bacterium]
MELEIDFSNVKDLGSMHQLLKEKFGFPDFYGQNVNALIDCWTSLKNPAGGMTKINIGLDEVLNLRVRALPFENLLVLNNFLIAVQSVNERYEELGFPPAITLTLI